MRCYSCTHIHSCTLDAARGGRDGGCDVLDAAHVANRTPAAHLRGLAHDLAMPACRAHGKLGTERAGAPGRERTLAQMSSFTFTQKHDPGKTHARQEQYNKPS